MTRTLTISPDRKNIAYLEFMEASDYGKASEKGIHSKPPLIPGPYNLVIYNEETAFVSENIVNSLAIGGKVLAPVTERKGKRIKVIQNIEGVIKAHHVVDREQVEKSQEAVKDDRLPIQISGAYS